MGSVLYQREVMTMESGRINQPRVATHVGGVAIVKVLMEYIVHRLVLLLLGFL